MGKDELVRDVEESEEELDEEEPEPVGLWEEKQKELVTTTVDYNLLTITKLISGSTIDLSPKYQRRHRWEPERKSRLIESFLLNIPIPSIFLNEDTYGKYSVIDGKQRLLAVSEYLNDEFKLVGLMLFTELNGKSYEELPDVLKSALMMRGVMRATIILRQSDSELKYEVFKRLNTGGVQLNLQEIRNTTFRGPLNDALMEMSEYPPYRQMLGIKDPSKSTLYQDMRDVELILRFFTFKDNWRSFTGQMSRTMDEYMKLNQYMPSNQIENERDDFFLTLQKVKAAFGEKAYHRFQPGEGVWRNQVVATLFDAQMFSCREFEAALLSKHSQQIIEGMKTLFNDEAFQKSLRSFNQVAFRTRVIMVKDMIEMALSS